MSSPSSPEVIIAGAGPVGSGLAIDLALRGVQVCLVERRVHPQRVPKGQNLTQRTGEHFAQWGVSAAIRAATPIPPSYGNEGLTAYRSILSGYHYDWFKRASVREFYAADNERLPQYEMEQILRARASSLPNVRVITGSTVTAATNTQTGVTVIISDGEGKGQVSRQLKARLLVGCDGAHSSVRQFAGLTETIDARGKRMALLVFRSSELSRLLDERFPGKTIFNALDPALQGYWQFLGRVDLEGLWFFHAPVPDDATQDNYDFTGLLHRAIGQSFSVEFDHVGFWDLRFTQADSYGQGNMFIAGDAAHSHPPYGGYGVNVGFEDARNLSWKLAARLQGWGNEALLATYTEERHPVFASTRDNFIAKMIEQDAAFTASFDPQQDRQAFEAAWQARAAGGQSEVQLYVPNYAGSSIVYGPPDAHSGATGIHAHTARAGHHLTPQVLSSGENVFDCLGQNFTLIAIEQPDDVVDAFRQAARRYSVPLCIVRSRSSAATAKWQANLILVRPDQFVAFAGNQLVAPALDMLRRATALSNPEQEFVSA
jgi:2-polyprenyl-6-methoxyphenol hydroxylase-like FAD-dependent oxidoreductase